MTEQIILDIYNETLNHLVAEGWDADKAVEMAKVETKRRIL